MGDKQYRRSVTLQTGAQYAQTPSDLTESNIT